MSYFSLTNRVLEASAVDPKALTCLYSTLGRLPMVRSTYDRVVAGALAQGVTQGIGLDLGTGPGYVAVEIARTISADPDACLAGNGLTWQPLIHVWPQGTGTCPGGRPQTGFQGCCPGRWYQAGPVIALERC
jgi:hypothetical protein